MRWWLTRHRKDPPLQRRGCHPPLAATGGIPGRLTQSVRRSAASQLPVRHLRLFFAATTVCTPPSSNLVRPRFAWTDLALHTPPGGAPYPLSWPPSFRLLEERGARQHQNIPRAKVFSLPRCFFRSRRDRSCGAALAPHLTDSLPLCQRRKRRGDERKKKRGTVPIYCTISRPDRIPRRSAIGCLPVRV